MIIFRCLLVGLVGICCFPDLALAQAPYLVTPNYSSIESSKGGYRTIEMTVETVDGRPVSGDVRLNLCLQYGQWREQTTVSAPLTIEAGKSKGSAKLLFCGGVAGGYSSIWIERDMDGQRNGRELFSDGINQNTWDAPNQSYLFVSSTVKPKNRAPVRAVAGGTFQNTSMTTNFGNSSDIGKDLPSFDVLADILSGGGYSNNKQFALAVVGIDTDLPKNLPDNWVELSTVQHIVISLSDLRQFGKDYPDKVAALKKWMAAGGRLVVNNCGEHCKDANQIQPALGLPVSSTSGWVQLKDESSISFGKRLKKQRGSPLDAKFLREQRNRRLFYNEHFEPFRAKPDSDKNKTPELKTLPFGQGQVVAIEDDMSKWSRGDWHTLIITTELLNGDFHSYIGSYVLNGEEMPNKKIPGVKEPPQSAFQFLIVCFVVVVGPINYFVLKRSQRLNVLLITVPLISFIACCLLFGYAFFVQGFGMKVRHDSVTFLDQQNNVAVSRSLHSIFSGLHPGRYTFPDDRLVFMATKGYDDSYVRYQNGTVSFSGGAIQARLPHQLSTIESFESQQGLRFSEKDGELQVRSDFNDPIECLLIVHKGKYYHVENLDPGAVGNAVVVSELGLQRLFASSLDEVIPDDRFRRNFDYWGLNNHVVDGAMVSPLSSSNIYMAVFKELDVVQPLGPKASYKSGAHVVVGRW